MFHLMRNLVTWASTRGEMQLNILLLGLDGAGKTTLGHGLKGDPAPDSIVPTMGFNFHRRDDGRRKVKFTDLGGGPAMRKIWSSYLGDAHGLIFVVDAADKARFSMAADILRDLGAQGALDGKPLLIFANKQDIQGAATAAEISVALDVDNALGNAGLAEYTVMSGIALPRGAIPGDDAHPGVPDESVHEAYRWAVGRVAKRFQDIQARVEAAEEARKREKPKQSVSEAQKRLDAIRARRRREEEEEEAARKLNEQENAQNLPGPPVSSPVRAPAAIGAAGADPELSPPRPLGVGGGAGVASGSSLSPLPPIAPQGGNSPSQDTNGNQALPGQTTL